MCKRVAKMRSKVRGTALPTTIIHTNNRRNIRIRCNHIRQHPHPYPHPRLQQTAEIMERRDMAARITPRPCTTPNGWFPNRYV